MGEHIELESEIVSHSSLKVGFCGDFVVEIVESVQPLVLGLDGGADTEFGRSVGTTPNVDEVLPFVLGRCRLDKADVLGYLVAVVLEVDKLADVVFVMWDASGENCDTGIGADTIEGVFVEGYDPFEGMAFED